MSTRINPYPNGPGQTSGRSDGSRTMTMHDIPTGESGGQGGSGSGDDEGEEVEGQHIGVLRLRGGGNTRRVVWTDETIDNEGMGKKKSKICCIFHKTKKFDESSDDSSGSDSGDSDSSISNTSAYSHGDDINASKSLREKRAKRKEKSDQCSHDHDDTHKDDHGSGSNRRQQRAGGSSTILETPSKVPDEKPPNKPTPNKYERGFA